MRSSAEGSALALCETNALTSSPLYFLNNNQLRAQARLKPSTLPIWPPNQTALRQRH